MTGGLDPRRLRGHLFVLSGPSGVGKDTVIVHLQELDQRLRRPAAFTTRAPRPGEREGREYSFVSEEQFSKMLEAGAFLETAVVHGHHYGTSRARVAELLAEGQDVLLKIDVQGAAKLRRDGTDAIFIFLAPPSRGELLARLISRHTESPEEVELRTADADRELAESRWYQHTVVNDEVDRAAREIAGIVAATR